jgi:hypothetical protein
MSMRGAWQAGVLVAAAADRAEFRAGRNLFSGMGVGAACGSEVDRELDCPRRDKIDRRVRA